MTVYYGENDQYEETEMTDPHEDLVEAMAQRLLWYFGIKSDIVHTISRDLLHIIAERTKDATPGMEAAGWALLDGVHLGMDDTWTAMHRASALWPKEKP